MRQTKAEVREKKNAATQHKVTQKCKLFCHTRFLFITAVVVCYVVIFFSADIAEKKERCCVCVCVQTRRHHK